jgi:hypothetical protein
MDRGGELDRDDLLVVAASYATARRGFRDGAKLTLS